MLNIVVVLLFAILINVHAHGPYHHIVIQIFNNEDTLVPSIVSVNEGSNLTLNCRTLHVIYHPNGNYYDEDVIWSRAQNWRLQGVHQKSIQNIQRKTKLLFRSITLEDQGRYICTSLKYHTSRILYILVQPKNRKEQYFRKRRDLTGNDYVSDLLPKLFARGLDERPHLVFVATAFFLISVMVVLMFLIKLCSKCKKSERKKVLQCKVHVVPVNSLPYTHL